MDFVSYPHGIPLAVGHSVDGAHVSAYPVRSLAIMRVATAWVASSLFCLMTHASDLTLTAPNGDEPRALLSREDGAVRREGEMSNTECRMMKVEMGRGRIQPRRTQRTHSRETPFINVPFAAFFALFAVGSPSPFHHSTFIIRYSAVFPRPHRRSFYVFAVSVSRCSSKGEVWNT